MVDPTIDLLQFTHSTQQAMGGMNFSPKNSTNLK